MKIYPIQKVQFTLGLLQPQLRFFASKISKNAVIELTEDSPYQFNNISYKNYRPKDLTPLANEGQRDFFRSAYEHLLQFICERNYETLQQMLEPKLYQEMSEYLKENIDLNEAELILENKDTDKFEVLVGRQYFTCGFHIDRSKNDKEYVIPYKPNFDYSGDLEVYTTKVPMKFSSMPLNIVYELVYRTNMKLNINRSKKRNIFLLEKDEIKSDEVHIIRYEGNIGDYGNDVEGINKMKRKYLKIKEQIKNGQLDEVQEWTITNIDNSMNTIKKA